MCLAERGSVYGDWPVYQGGAVDNTQLLEEHDACGVGFIASLKGERTHKIVKDSLTAVGCMEHRGACSADNDSGDGVGGAVRKEDTDILEMWNAAIAEMSKDGTTAEITKEWFGRDISM